MFFGTKRAAEEWARMETLRTYRKHIAVRTHKLMIEGNISGWTVVLVG